MGYERDQITSVAPFCAADGFRRLTTSAVSASISLTQGMYEAYNAASIDLILKHGAAASLPASGAAEVAGVLVVPAGAVTTLEIVTSATALHAALVSAGAGELYLRRIAVSP